MRSIIFIIALFSNLLSTAQELPRRADIGARISDPNGTHAGAVVRSVKPNSQLDKAGLQTGDRIIKLNGEIIIDPNRWSDLKYDLHAGQELTLQVQRGDDLINVSATLDPLGMESFDRIETVYDMVVSSKGQRIRTIITRPKEKTGRLPAIFLIGGLSCSSIELYPGRPILGWTQVLSDLVVKSGMVLMRVEKPGVGDSEGHCGESDFEHDLAAFRSALSSLFSKDYVDTTKIVLYGSSMGSAIAPVLANEFTVAGVVSDGTFVKNWFEHKLELERRIKAFQGKTPEEIALGMNQGSITL